jgi:hypothetical protein
MLRANAVRSLLAATEQGCTTLVTISETLWGVLQSSALSAGTHKRSTPTAKETTSLLAKDMNCCYMPAEKHGNKGGEILQSGLERAGKRDASFGTSKKAN